MDDVRVVRSYNGILIPFPRQSIVAICMIIITNKSDQEVSRILVAELNETWTLVDRL